jgi:hypothetical protein
MSPFISAGCQAPSAKYSTPWMPLASWEIETAPQYLQESDLDVAGVVRGGDERPGDLAVVPVVEEVADRLAAALEAVDGGRHQVEVERVVAAPGVRVAAGVGDDHVEGGAVVLVLGP